jgi:hypothetical protein
MIALTHTVPTSLAFAILIAPSATVRALLVYTLQLPWTWFTLITNLDLLYQKVIPNGHSLTERSKREIRDTRKRANLARTKTRTEKEAMKRIRRQAIETLGALVRRGTDLVGEMLGERGVEVTRMEKGVFLEGENLV